MAPKDVDTQARKLLQTAGVHPDTIELLIGLGAAQSIVDQPEMVPAIAAQNPAVELSQYEQARTTYGFDSELTTDTFGGAGGADALARNAIVKKGYRTNQSGALFFENGVIADPTSGQVFLPVNDATVPGSFAWLEQVQESWTADKIEEWRKRLSQYGYDISKEGDVDQTFLAALKQYHEARYLNGGKAIPLDQSLADKTGEDRVFDPAEVRNAVRQKFRTDWGDDPSEAELESWSKFVMSLARRQVKKGLDPAAAAVVAEERFIEKFESDPKLQFFQEAEEEKTELRDSLLGVLQSVNSVARSS